mgnify:CR=1 FL=1
MQSDSLSAAARAAAAAAGAYVGDALAMPAHWFYDQAELERTFGTLDEYRDPPQHHPGSILWRSRYEPSEPEFDILGSARSYWGRRGVHYHQFLRAGENTLNLKLLRLVLDMVDEIGGYDRGEFISRYRRFMLDPDGHRDTYVEECHRGYFENVRRGIDPGRCAVSEKHIGGMVAVVPLYAALVARGVSSERAAETVQDHVSVTHAGSMVADAVRTLVTVGEEILAGEGLEEALRAHLRRQDLPFLQGPIERAARRDVRQGLGRVYSTACYLDESMPAVFYLALRYPDSPQEGLVANTMAGGDNCHRGAVLGALYGLAGADFPQHWVSGLRPDDAVSRKSQ